MKLAPALAVLALAAQLAAADPFEDSLTPLTAAVERSSPGVHGARGHVHAAMLAADELAPAEVLLAMAWVESRYTTTGVSRLECRADGCHRRTGPWPGPKPQYFAAPYFCGYHGAKARSWAACRDLAGEGLESYVRAADHLHAWWRFCGRDGLARRHGDRLSCAVAGYNGGVAGARAGRTAYSVQVIYRARRLAAGWPAGPAPRV
jgi:hypothetical protein